MDSSDNSTNEKSSGFEDTGYDPDLEARLYAEIYYSNETYEKDSTPIVDNPPDRQTRSPSEHTAAPVESNRTSGSEGNVVRDSIANDTDRTVGHFADPKTFFPSRVWVWGGSNGDTRSSVRRQSPGQRVLKPQRPLARKDLWLPRVQPEAETRSGDSTSGNRQDIASPGRTTESTRTSSVLSCSAVAESIRLPDRSHEPTDISVLDRNYKRMVDRALKKKAKYERRKQLRILKKNDTRAAKKLLKRLKRGDNVGTTTDNSKYEVVSKTNKLNMKRFEPEPVNISSDSDDSILEVPVPPKAPPPIVELQDSDDDNRESRRFRSEEIHVESRVSRPADTESPGDDGTTVHDDAREPAKKTRRPEICVATPTNLSEDYESVCETSSSVIRETGPTDSSKNLTETPRNPRTSEINVTPTPNPVESDLILNLTEIQKSVSCLEDIRRLRDGEMLSRAYSDDSMTESEMNNWNNIANGQANAARENPTIGSIDSPIDSDNTAIWDQLTRETRASLVSAPNEITTIRDRSTDPIETFAVAAPAAAAAENLEISVINSEEVNPRKRPQLSGSSAFRDFDVPAVPEKRIKPNRQKTNRAKSDVEYFFQPMSKELQAFYNNPWGGENLDVCDIQSRMPRNPRCWAILNADMRGPTSRRRNTCPRCKTDSHVGRRCPQKPKPPCCYMCGTKGHTESRCPHTMCLTCGRKYATYRPTCGYCSKLYCTMCNGAGHSCEECPDLWRRYHSTTTETMPIVPRDTANIMKSIQNLYCCNCARRGHDVTMCRQLRWSQHFPTSMNISSYTDGPMYEPSYNYDCTDETSPDEQLIFGSPQSVMFDFDAASSGIVSETSRSGGRRMTPVSDDIETIVINDDSSLSKAPVSIDQCRVIFSAGEFDERKTMRWQVITRRLDTTKNFHLTGLLDGRLKPNFLTDWQKYFDFGFKIIHNATDGLVCGTLQCSSYGFIKPLMKVIRQWLFRTDDEKIYLVYDQLPYDNFTLLNQELQKKIMQMTTVLAPVPALLKIQSDDKFLKKNTVTLSEQSSTKTYKRNQQRLNSIDSSFGSDGSGRCHLVMSLYKNSKAKTAKDQIRRFHSLADQLQQTGVMFNPDDYCELVYLYNEIFTFRKTKWLEKDLARAVNLWQRSRKSLPRHVLEYPSPNPVEINESNAERIVGDITNHPIPEQNNFFPLMTDQRQQPVPTNDSVEDSLRILEDLNAPCTSSDPQFFHDCHSSNDDGKTTLEKVKSTKRGRVRIKDKKNRHVFLRDMPKRRRNGHLGAAKTAIKVANGMNIPELEKIVRDLSCKIRTNNVQLRDIDLLNTALNRQGWYQNMPLPSPRPLGATNNDRQSGMSQQTQTIERPHVSDPAYVKFLKTL